MCVSSIEEQLVMRKNPANMKILGYGILLLCINLSTASIELGSVELNPAFDTSADERLITISDYAAGFGSLIGEQNDLTMRGLRDSEADIDFYRILVQGLPRPPAEAIKPLRNQGKMTKSSMRRSVSTASDSSAGVDGAGKAPERPTPEIQVSDRALAIGRRLTELVTFLGRQKNDFSLISLVPTEETTTFDRTMELLRLSGMTLSVFSKRAQAANELKQMITECKDIGKTKKRALTDALDNHITEAENLVISQKKHLEKTKLVTRRLLSRERAISAAEGGEETKGVTSDDTRGDAQPHAPGDLTDEDRALAELLAGYDFLNDREDEDGGDEEYVLDFPELECFIERDTTSRDLLPNARDLLSL